MKLRYKVAYDLLIFMAVTLSSLTITLSYSSAYGQAPTVSDETEQMKAIVGRCYGLPDVLELADVEKPTPRTMKFWQKSTLHLLIHSTGTL